MSDFGVDRDEMKRINDIEDRDIERLLAGQAPEGDPDLQELACFFAEAAALNPETSTESLETTHVAAMLEAARGTAAGEAGERPAGAPSSRRTSVGGKVWANKWARVAIVTAALVLAFGGMAFAAILPAPVQDAVAGAAQQVGIPVPDSNGSLSGLQAGPESDDESETVEPADVEDQNEDIDDADETEEIEAPDTDEDAIEAPDVEEQSDSDEKGDAPRSTAPGTSTEHESGESDD